MYVRICMVMANRCLKANVVHGCTTEEGDSILLEALLSEAANGLDKQDYGKAFCKE